MRFWIPVLGLAVFSLWRTLAADPEAVAADPPAPPPAVAARPSGADQPGSDLWRRLDPSPLWRDAAAPELPPDPVVHCVASQAGDAFVRQSECERRGGHPEEPSWARSD